MLTHHILSSKEQTPVYHWLPVSYLLLFGGVFLICLWAEVNRRQQLNKAQTTCSGVGASPMLPKVTGRVQSAPKPKLLRYLSVGERIQLLRWCRRQKPWQRAEAPLASG